MVDRLTPVPVAGGFTFASLVVGGSNACGLTSAGAAYCWGDNYFGNVGDGTTGNLRPAPVAVAGGLQFTSLDGGGGPHTCGLVAGGAAYCWGNNELGNIGDSTALTIRLNRQPWVGLAFVALTTGIHTCGLTSSGTAYCWGATPQMENSDAQPLTAGVPPQSGATFPSAFSTLDSHTPAASPSMALRTAGAEMIMGNWAMEQRLTVWFLRLYQPE
jgi:alpha-tubulin suppressor-like RCC1 family protein